MLEESSSVEEAGTTALGPCRLRALYSLIVRRASSILSVITSPTRPCMRFICFFTSQCQLLLHLKFKSYYIILLNSILQNDLSISNNSPMTADRTHERPDIPFSILMARAGSVTAGTIQILIASYS